MRSRLVGAAGLAIVVAVVPGWSQTRDRAPHNPLTEKAEDNSNPFEHTMLRGNNMDRYAVSYHGYAHSHIDALCHILYKAQTYNGYARADVNTDKGCTKLGIDNLKNGVVTRVILVDLPRLRNLPYLEP